MAALGELHHGLARGERDFVLVRLSTGLGTGVVIRGKLYHGSRWAAGEIAHMILDLSRAGEDWSARGYLESVVGADCILNRLQSAGVAVPNGDLPAFLETARHDGGAARRILDDVVLHLGVAIANLISAYDPSLVVLQGDLFRPILADVTQIVTKAVPWQTRVCLSSISAEAVLLGTTVAARSHVYERIGRTLSEQADISLELLIA
jgi:predicted NBD/HSP70 family sugar kinase